MRFHKTASLPQKVQKILSFCKFYRAPLLLLAFLAVIGFYFYYWFVIQGTSAIEEVREEEIQLADTEAVNEMEEEIIEVIIEDENVGDSEEDEISFDEHLLLKPNIAQQPDIDSIVHVSRLISLESSDSIVLSQTPLEGENINSAKEQDGRVKIAIVIDDMGASPNRTSKITEIKAPLTSSFVTFASQLTRQVNKAKAAGHEIMVHIPMQPKSNIFVSDDVLTVDMTQQQIGEIFEKMLQKFEQPVGANNHMGSKFTEYEDKLAPVMQLLAKHKMFFLDSKTTPKSQGESTAKKYNVPTVHRHVFLDNKDELEYILGQLEKTEKIAHKNGYAIAIGHPKIQTAQALKVWIKTLKDKGIELVWLSELVDKKEEK